MDKPLPPLPNAAALRGSDAGLSSVPDSAQQSQRPLVQIADADYEYTRCRFTHSLCVPLTALRSRLRCPRCLKSNAFGLQLLISGTRILQKTARLVQVTSGSNTPSAGHLGMLQLQQSSCLYPSISETESQGLLPHTFHFFTSFAYFDA